MTIDARQVIFGAQFHPFGERTMISTSNSYDRYAAIPSGIEPRLRALLVTAPVPTPVMVPIHPQERMA